MNKDRGLMTIKQRAIVLLCMAILSCNTSKKETSIAVEETYADINMVGAMKNVMWKNELGSIIDIDTIPDREGLYGLGPESYLTGELLINNGISYVSKVTSDTTMSVEKRFDVSAPFFVYAKVTAWKTIKLPSHITTIQDLEDFIEAQTNHFKRPFAFKVTGRINSASIHIQNLPEGTKVTSPDEAHQGQVSYNINNQDVEIVGFFSTEHKGIFTHPDTFLHMHLITSDERSMGHLDTLFIGTMQLYLPIK
ncbi:acetolactate decarboxylase [Paucihalobacter sp.]|uniref:acetolactate decarboxylase n=1 Tax=Paucihalobacter sp. TaxID=2850405 RepID=UPI002FE04375